MLILFHDAPVSISIDPKDRLVLMKYNKIIIIHHLLEMRFA